VFDSGVGGLWVLHEIHQLLPHESTIYLADQANVPYGSRTLADVREFSIGITRYLLEQSCKLVVVACNTASAAALHHLRELYPATPFVGMEPAVKPAAELTLSRKVAVLATPTTFQGALFESVVERFASDVELVEVVLPDLVEQIEQGFIDDEITRGILERHLFPLSQAGIDTLVLACTHYAFVIPVIEQLMGPSVQVIDPAPAIARQTARLLEDHDLASTESRQADARYLTTGEAAALQLALIRLLGLAGEIETVSWDGMALGPR
jgi:glutamate racemase